MPTNQPRVNITLDPQMMDQIAFLAKENNQSLSGLSKELLAEALELREEQSLSEIAMRRDTHTAKKVGHHDAWR